MIGYIAYLALWLLAAAYTVLSVVALIVN